MKNTITSVPMWIPLTTYNLLFDCLVQFLRNEDIKTFVFADQKHVKSVFFFISYFRQDDGGTKAKICKKNFEEEMCRVKTGRETMKSD